jgi:hypothetical protein
LGHGESVRFDETSAVRPKSAHEIDDEGNQQNQAQSATADYGPAKVKTATTEQEN